MSQGYPVCFSSCKGCPLILPRQIQTVTRIYSITPNEYNAFEEASVDTRKLYQYQLHWVLINNNSPFENNIVYAFGVLFTCSPQISQNKVWRWTWFFNMSLELLRCFFFQFIESEAWAENEESIGDLIQ